MGLGYFVIAILGCADGGSQCTPLTTTPTHYATEDQCAAATGEALLNSTAFDYPTLVARCRPASAPSTGERKLKSSVSGG